MTHILLAAMVAVFVLAFAVEVVRRKKRDSRSWLQRFMDDVRRGFDEGYRGETRGVPESAQVT